MAHSLWHVMPAGADRSRPGRLVPHLPSRRAPPALPGRRAPLPAVASEFRHRTSLESVGSVHSRPKPHPTHSGRRGRVKAAPKRPSLSTPESGHDRTRPFAVRGATPPGRSGLGSLRTVAGAIVFHEVDIPSDPSLPESGLGTLWPGQSLEAPPVAARAQSKAVDIACFQAIVLIRRRTVIDRVRVVSVSERLPRGGFWHAPQQTARGAESRSRARGCCVTAPHIADVSISVRVPHGDAIYRCTRYLSAGIGAAAPMPAAPSSPDSCGLCCDGARP